MAQTATVEASEPDASDPTSNKALDAASFLQEILGKKLEQVERNLKTKLAKQGKKIADFAKNRSVVCIPIEFPPVSAGEFRTFVWFNAEMAITVLMERNKKNRAIDPIKVYDYALSLLAGEWNPSHPDAILFSDEDPSELMNGQHRLVALIIVSQILGEDLVKWRFPVEFNKPKELMPLLDTGRVRSAADKALMAMKEEGVEFDKATYNDVRVSIMVELANSMHMGQVWGPGELNEFVMEHRDLLAECYKLLRRIQGPRYNASVAAAFAKAALPNYFGKDVIFPLAERLVNQTFKSGEDPLRELYNRLLRIKDRKEKLSNKERYGLTVKAIRKALLEENVKNLHITYIDWTEEEARDYAVKGKTSSVLFAMSRKNTPEGKKKADKKEKAPAVVDDED